MDRRFRPDANPYLVLLEFIRKRKSAALATIVEARGSTPQAEGASALFSAKGLAAGTIGGGIVEAEVQKKALRAMEQKISGLIAFSLARDASEAEGGICGGRLRILIEGSPEKNAPAFRAVALNSRTRKPGLLATFMERDPRKKRLKIRRLWAGPKILSRGLSRTPFRGFAEEFREAAQEKKPRLACRKSRLLYLEPHFPAPRLVIAGAGHIGQAVAHLGKLLDFEVTVIDDRPEYANRDRFPEADRIIAGDIGEAVRKFPITADTYVVIVTRGHVRDEEALRACVGRPAGYIGMIGSRRKVSLMREYFLRLRWASAADFDKVHAPIGIDIRSRSVQEIAVSVAAELVLVRGQNER